MNEILWVVSAFILFTMGLPALGFTVGFVIRVLPPYLIGALTLFVPIAEAIAVGVILVWATTIWISRQVLKRKFDIGLAWHEGHFLAIAHLCSPKKIG